MTRFSKPRYALLKPSLMVDRELSLKLMSSTLPGHSTQSGPTYDFDIRIHEATRVGGIRLRIGDEKELTHFLGQVGYGVSAQFRGRRYAARACRLILPFAYQNGLDDLWITTTPDNMPSRRTCELAGAELVEVIDVPHTHWLYRERGVTRQCRYRINLRPLFVR